MRRRSVLTAGLTATALVATAAMLPSNIDVTEKYAWGENVGWVDFRADTTNGVCVTTHYLSGYAWSENVGWLFFGNGPENGQAYTQVAGDTGVNNDGAGRLSGYAWGENIGWVILNPADSDQQVRINAQGRFLGYAWGENVGWINMHTAYGVKSDRGFPNGTAAHQWQEYH